MVATNPTAMRLRSEKLEKRIGNSASNVYGKQYSDDEEIGAVTASPKGKRGSAKTRKSGVVDNKPVPNWLVYLMLFVVVGGSIVQIFNNITTQPSMSDSH